MKTEFQYIKMVKIADRPKTSVWEVQNKKGEYSLGIIKWNPGWRQYCYFPDDGLVFSAGCLQDICKFIAELRQQGKQPINDGCVNSKSTSKMVHLFCPKCGCEEILPEEIWILSCFKRFCLNGCGEMQEQDKPGICPMCKIVLCKCGKCHTTGCTNNTKSPTEGK